MKAAVSALELYRNTLKTNEPINRAEGNIEQADAEAANLVEVEAALARLAGGNTFGDAIAALKSGKRVSRAGWNGKGMYLWLLPAAMVKAEWCREPHLKAMAEANGGEIEALGSIRMMTADKKVLTGWLASQTDVLAEDWTILPDA